jgi:indole-3-glycerol phosphate synthase
MSEDILARIAVYKRAEVAERKARTSQGLLDRKAAGMPPPRGFRRALVAAHSPGLLALLGEIKRASPSRGLIREDFNPIALARAYQAGGAACLSVRTDAPSFQGADSYLADARTVSSLPLLRKDFMIDPWQIGESRALGADCVLVILAMVEDDLARELLAEAARFGMDALVEVHDEIEMGRAGGLRANLIGVNNRDLRTFEVDLANTERLAREAPAGALLVTESGIFTPADAARLEAAGAKAMLVGESLMRQADVAAATRALLG